MDYKRTVFFHLPTRFLSSIHHYACLLYEMYFRARIMETHTQSCTHKPMNLDPVTCAACLYMYMFVCSTYAYPGTGSIGLIDDINLLHSSYSGGGEDGSVA